MIIPTTHQKESFARVFKSKIGVYGGWDSVFVQEFLSQKLNDCREGRHDFPYRPHEAPKEIYTCEWCDFTKDSGYRKRKL